MRSLVSESDWFLAHLTPGARQRNLGGMAVCGRQHRLHLGAQNHHHSLGNLPAPGGRGGKHTIVAANARQRAETYRTHRSLPKRR
jgi:hypothetical protein